MICLSFYILSYFGSKHFTMPAYFGSSDITIQADRLRVFQECHGNVICCVTCTFQLLMAARPNPTPSLLTSAQLSETSLQYKCRTVIIKTLREVNPTKTVVVTTTPLPLPTSVKKYLCLRYIWC